MGEVTRLPRWMAPADAADVLGISERALRKRAVAGSIERKRQGRRTLYLVEVPEPGPEPSGTQRPRAEPETGPLRPAPEPSGTEYRNSGPVVPEPSDLAAQVERLAREVGRLEAELAHARASASPSASGDASSAEEARIARQSRAQVVEWLQRNALWEAYLDDALGEDADRR